MDLKHDWKALGEVLFQQTSMSSNASTLVLLEDGGKVIDGVVSNGKAFAERGADGVSSNKEKLDGLAARYGTDQAVVLPKKDLDQLIVDAASLGTNYFQQLQSLRTKVLGQIGKARNSSAGGLIISRRHFVLDLFGTQLRRILPRRFNVLLFVDERAPTGAFNYRSILLSYSRGQLDQFFEPDFSSLHENRLVNWQSDLQNIGQYLESRYILPCYAIFMMKEDWDRCLEAASAKGKPWHLFVRYHDEGRAAVYPKKTLTQALLAAQRILVYFARL